MAYDAVLLDLVGSGFDEETEVEGNLDRGHTGIEHFSLGFACEGQECGSQFHPFLETDYAVPMRSKAQAAGQELNHKDTQNVYDARLLQQSPVSDST